MSDVTFQIVGDASKADKAIDSVLDRLEAIKRQAAQASLTPGIDKMAAGFAKLGEAIRKEQAALTRTSQIHQQLTAQNTPLAKSFASVAEAIQREQQMLERLHGPAKQHAQDLQTLDALMKKGAITAREYSMATSRSPSVGSYNVAKVGLPGLGGMGGLAAAAGGVLGGQAAFGALDDFQNMQNRLRFLAGGDVQKVTSLFTQLQGVAGRTRQSLGATTETFVKVSMATKQMGMSTSDTMQFMERLNKAVALSGASSSAASAGLMQLSQGLSAGALRGEEFNSVVEQIPAVAQVIADSLGVTTGQLRVMAQDGKLTADVVINAFNKMGTSIDKDFGNTLPTVGQHWQMFKDKMTVAVGEMDRALGIADKLGTVMEHLGDSFSIDNLKNGKGLVFDAFNVLTLGQGTRALEGRLTREADESLKGVEKTMSELTSSTDEWGFAITRTADEMAALNITLGDFKKLASGSKPLVGADLKQVNDDLDQYQKVMGSFSRGQLSVMDAIMPSKEAIARAKALREEYERLARALLGMPSGLAEDARDFRENPVSRAIREGAADRAAQQAQNDYVSQLEANATPAIKRFALELDQLEQAYESLGLTEEAYLQERNRLYADAYDKGMFGGGASNSNAQQKAHEDWTSTVKMYEDMAEKSRELAEEQKKQAQEVKEAWARELGQVGRSFVEAFGDSKQSASEMMQSLMRDIAMLLGKMAALRLIQGGGSSAVAGNLLTGLVGHAHGGVVYQGSGGTDSQIYAFRKSPNESVTHIIETPEQRRSGALRGGAGGGASTVIVQLQNDRRDIVQGVNSDDGAVAVANMMLRRGWR